MTHSKQRSDHRGLTLQEIGDRLAIRELIDAYAHCADRRDVEGQMSLFTENTEFLVTWTAKIPTLRRKFAAATPRARCSRI